MTETANTVLQLSISADPPSTSQARLDEKFDARRLMAIPGLPTDWLAAGLGPTAHSHEGALCELPPTGYGGENHEVCEIQSTPFLISGTSKIRSIFADR